MSLVAKFPPKSSHVYQNACRSFSKSSLAAIASSEGSIPHQQTRDDRYNQLMKATTLSLAPMMEYTDRHFRHLVRLVSSETLLYTEMVAANALVHERKDAMERYCEENPEVANDETHVRANYESHYLRRFLRQSGIEVPPAEGASVLQLGGSDPEQLYGAVQTVMEMTERGICDYTAINLNCGCPSPKVAGKGCFGAALMDDPKLVAELTSAMHEGCQGQIPITVKCRIGTDSNQAFNKAQYAQIDEEKEYNQLCEFIEAVASPGIVSDFSVHARIAVLQKSFSPADNRKIPPLKYHYIQKLVEDYPEFTFSVNGGIETIPEIKAQLEASPGLKGVMVGRSWAADPWSFAMADHVLYNKEEPSTLQNRYEILKAYAKYADEEERQGDPVKIRRFITKAITPLFSGEKNSKRYRIALDEIAGIPKKLHSQGKSLEGQPPISELIMNCALEHLPEDALYRSREESYKRVLEAEERKNGSDRSTAVQEWQTRRKLESDGSYERMLSVGMEPSKSDGKLQQNNVGSTAEAV